ncbi:MupG family TIM beta-alpha barrel fold protein [Ectobacillus sp. JY-23]|uniref:DUF871 domain-containing protein n=1 Tax=Ectobacillus sp. JY-23 TaxID=2933872 RepID=UPI001FF4E19F|nr:MupG family TIM beta-alpha barrel fold protein [Ectobacillus sp. JY-23]UOY92020.1 MupG family TIM beta-alpha barrel fold protein [Ectobacillus sp. JY-23]
MLGISVYLSNENKEKNEQWIAKAKSYGFQHIFTSLHIPEDDPSTYKELLMHLGKQALQHDMELMADVSPKSLSYLGLDYQTVTELKNWGVAGLRVDYGLEAKEVAQLSHSMKIALNASTVTEGFLQELLHFDLHVANVEAWHNFYPRPETGLDKRYVEEKNRWFHSFGITTMAFIPGEEPRGPIFQGLPTVEEHRYMRTLEAYLSLKRYGTDKVLIGDICASDTSMGELAQAEYGVIPLRCESIHGTAEDLKRVEGIHTNRLDPARDVIRSVESRSYAMQGVSVMPQQTIERSIGSITIDNERYGRYSGELQITITDLCADEKVNVIGRICREDIPLLSYIGAGQRFLLQVKTELK